MFLVADQRFLSVFVADQGLLDVFSGRVTVCHQVMNCKQKMEWCCYIVHYNFEIIVIHKIMPPVVRRHICHEV